MSERSQLVLKGIWLVHFALSSWAIMGAYLGSTPAYMFTQIGVLACGFWPIVAIESLEATVMFMVALSFSIVNDVVIISIYKPRADSTFDNIGLYHGLRDEYRFALGMSIVNLICKAISIVLVYSVHESRANGSEFALIIPGVTRSSGNASNRSGRGQYTTIESAQDTHPNPSGFSGSNQNTTATGNPHYYNEQHLPEEP